MASQSHHQLLEYFYFQKYYHPLSDVSSPSKKICCSPFQALPASKSPLSRFGVSSASTIVYLPFWDFVDFHNCLSPLLGSRRLSKLSLSPLGVSPGSPNCYNLKGEESQIRNSHNKQKNTVFNNF